jgi:hypothetical protein
MCEDCHSFYDCHSDNCVTETSYYKGWDNECDCGQMYCKRCYKVLKEGFGDSQYHTNKTRCFKCMSANVKIIRTQKEIQELHNKIKELHNKIKELHININVMEKEDIELTLIGNNYLEEKKRKKRKQEKYIIIVIWQLRQ